MFSVRLLLAILSLLIVVGSSQCPSRTFIEKSLLDVHVPGAVVLAVNTNDILYREAFGHLSFLPTQLMDVDRSIFLLASISTTSIAVATMQLVESDILLLDPCIFNPFYPSSPVALRQLLSHSASVGNSTTCLVEYPKLAGYSIV